MGLEDPLFAQRLRLNLPAKLTQAARKRWTADLVKEGCPALAGALLATLDDDAPFDRVVAELAGGRRDHAPIALPLWPSAWWTSAPTMRRSPPPMVCVSFSGCNIRVRAGAAAGEPRQEVRDEIARRT